ncbi:MAG: HAMP domain-containing sensor histidine kinase [Acidimicrobiales bacterium]
MNLPTVNAVYVEVFPLDQLRRNLIAMALSLLAGSAVTVAGAAAVGHWASRQVLSPVARVADAAEALAGGGLDTRLPPVRDPDLHRLVRSFNEMADAIQSRIEREARFASDVSHELRTPLAALAAASDVLVRRREELSGPAQQALDIMARQIQRFTSMVLDLLEIAASTPAWPTSTSSPSRWAGSPPRWWPPAIAIRSRS